MSRINCWPTLVHLKIGCVAQRRAAAQKALKRNSVARIWQVLSKQPEDCLFAKVGGEGKKGRRQQKNKRGGRRSDFLKGTVHVLQLLNPKVGCWWLCFSGNYGHRKTKGDVLAVPIVQQFSFRCSLQRALLVKRVATARNLRRRVSLPPL